MPLRTLIAFFGFVAALAGYAQPVEQERNFWPVRVSQVDEAGKIWEWQGGGPLFFHKLLTEQRTAEGFRPFYMRKEGREAGNREISVLYPIFVYRRDNETYRWSIFELINVAGPRASQPAGPTAYVYRGLDVWPFYFSRDTGSPETTYHALFPIYGTVRDRLFNEKAGWVLAPLYVRTENKGVVATSAPWPFIRVINGAGNSGFYLWPLFGWRGKPGVHHSQFYLWPLIYKNESGLDRPVPSVASGFLPFYAQDHSPGYKSESFGWPFFGYSDRTIPYRYHETWYFWPFFVQGRGEDHYRNRWAPFYTHSVMKGVDKQWYVWPLIRREQFTDQGLVQTKTQFLYFIYWTMRQSSATNPQLASAVKTHLWPLYSGWDNGAGRRQVQILSPFEVLLPHNENVRLLWSPLFALYRFEQSAPGTTRNSLLFDFVTWRNAPEQHEFHLGPLFSVAESPTAKRIAIAGGLLSFRRTADRGWRPFWFDFSSGSNKSSPPSR
jgi:hypothetical protein